MGHTHTHIMVATSSSFSITFTKHLKGGGVHFWIRHWGRRKTKEEERKTGDEGMLPWQQEATGNQGGVNGVIPALRCLHLSKTALSVAHSDHSKQWQHGL